MHSMKNIIAIAIAFLVALPICAQSNVSVAYAENLEAMATIQVKKCKFKKRNSLTEIILNDFDRTELNGYRVNLQISFTNTDEQTHVISPDSFALINGKGKSCNMCDASDIRRDYLIGNQTVSPDIATSVILSYIVADKDDHFTLKFNGYVY